MCCKINIPFRNYNVMWYKQKEVQPKSRGHDNVMYGEIISAERFLRERQCNVMPKLIPRKIISTVCNLGAL